MRRTVVPLLLAALALLLWPTTPASAGGPTSVLLSVPGEGRSTALYYTDSAYEELSRAVGVGTTGGRATDPGGHGAATPVTLTWLIHDVTPWRVDRVFVHDDGTTWVMTQESLGGGPLAGVAPVWHRGEPGLARLLEQLLPGGNGYFDDTAVDPLPAPQAETSTPRAGPAPIEGVSPQLLAGVGIGGLLVGVLGTLVAFAVRRSAEQLPEPAAPESADDVPVGEQLVWP